jgi:hypothetical protein
MLESTFILIGEVLRYQLIKWYLSPWTHCLESRVTFHLSNYERVIHPEFVSPAHASLVPGRGY